MATRKSASVATIASLLLLATAPLISAAPPLMRHEIDTLPVPPLRPRQQRRQSSGGYTAVTGILSNQTQPRLEFRDLEKNTDQFNLYLLALDRFMKVDEQDKLSYYQIAGTPT